MPLYLNVLQDGEDIAALLEEMTEEYEQKKSGVSGRFKGYLMVLLSKIFRLAITKDAKRTTSYQKRDYRQRNFVFKGELFAPVKP